MVVETAPEYRRKKEVWMIPVEVYSRKDQDIGPKDVQLHFTCSKGAVCVRVAGDIEVSEG